METFTPVFPKGLVGTITGLKGPGSDLFEAFANFSIEATIDPAPAIPVILKNSLRDKFFSFFDIFNLAIDLYCRFVLLINHF
ncbi:MAG: hypothetical protein V3S72_10255 [Desulfobacterales bacterium]